MSLTLLEERLAAAKYRSLSIVDNGDVGLVVRYKGAQASGLVAVNSSGVLSFTHGAVGAEVADTTIGLPTLNGTITVSDTSADTFGEVIDNINASANWEGFLVDVLRADSSNASTGSLATLSATQANKTAVPSGVRLFKTTSKVLNLSIALTNKIFPDGYNRVDDRKVNFVSGIISTNTFGSGTSKIQIYEINPVTKSETKVFEIAGGATTVQQLLDNRQVQASGDQGNYLLVRLIGSAACTGNLNVVGRTW